MASRDRRRVPTRREQVGFRDVAHQNTAGRELVNTSAIVMMVLALATLWGGLILSVLHLRKHPDEIE
nr:methionine/alanine import family NSS transporter small subunit [Rhodococcus sp. HNM0563]